MSEERKVSLEELLKKIDERLDAKLSPIVDRLNVLETKSNSNEVHEHEHVHKDIEFHTQVPKSVHIGEMEVIERGDKADIVCPECGRMHTGLKLPVKEKVIEKPVIPSGYMRMPEKWEDIKKILDLPHPDNHSIFDCPKCSREFAKYIASNKEFVKLIEKASRGGKIE